MSSQSAAPAWDEIRGILKEVSSEQREISASQKETARQIKEVSAERREMSAERRKMSAEQRKMFAERREMFAERREASRQLDQLQKENARQIREVSASQRENARQIKEVSAERRETDRQMKETARQMKETDRKMKETDRKMKETAKEVKSLSDLFRNQWGSLVESLVRGKIVKLLQGRGIDVSETAANIKIHQSRMSKAGQIRKETVCELDLVAENGSECVVVEVKSALRQDDAQKLAELLPRLSELNPKRFKGKKVYGALAYLKRMGNAHVLAEEYGFFLIEGTGDSAHIVNKPNFQPKAY